MEKFNYSSNVSLLWRRISYCLLLILTVDQYSNGTNFHLRNTAAFVIRRATSSHNNRRGAKNNNISLLQRSLFFRQTLEDLEKQLNIPRRRRSRRRRYEVPDHNIAELCNGPVEYPYQIDLEYNNGGGNNPRRLAMIGENNRRRKEEVDNEDDDNNNKRLYVRHLEIDDISSILPMCIKEYVDGGKATTLKDFPFDNITSWKEIMKWFDNFIFPTLVSSAIKMKIQRRIDGDDFTKPSYVPDDNILCLTFGNDTVIGIVELSLQPPDAERNPPPFPIPMIFKKGYCKSEGLGPPVCWVSNVLIDEDYRGLGFSKILMYAVEGLAISWGYNSIFLHTVADSVSGKAAQGLYNNLGYEPVMQDSSSNQAGMYEWMQTLGSDMLKTGLYMVDGVPLLFMRKDLTKNKNTLATTTTGGMGTTTSVVDEENVQQEKQIK